MKIRNIIFFFISIMTISCVKKTDQDRAIDLVRAKYVRLNQKLNFDDVKLDSLYNIPPKAYADSLRKGNELDSILAVLESQIEQLNQKESDSVGLIGAALTKERCRLLELVKIKPKFID